MKRFGELENQRGEPDAKVQAELLEAREQTLAAELAKAGIKLPEENLRATPVRLTKSDADRAKAVNELVK